MTDIARLGVAFDTGDLREGKAALDALVPAAKRAQTATGNLSKAANGLLPGLGGAASGADRLSGALARAARGSDLSQRALLASSTAMRTVQGAAAGASASVNVLGTTANSLDSRIDVLSASIYALSASIDVMSNNFAQSSAQVEAYKRSLAGVTPAAKQAKSSIDNLGAAANDNINRMQSTPANIAAQFQDIGVTAAMGMSPMMIALQQGTQLSSAMAGGVGNLLAGFKQLITPTTILTVALVGLVAAGFQMVDWTSLAQDALNGLADGIEAASVYIVAFTAAITVMKLPTIITGIWSLATAFYGLAAGILATIGLPVLLVGGLLLVIAAAVRFRDELTQYFGVDIVGAAETGVNYIVAFFVGGFNALKATWSQLPGAMGDIAFSTANAVVLAIEGMINRSIAKINALTSMANSILPEMLSIGQIGYVNSGGVNNPYAGQAAAVAQEWGTQTRNAAAKAGRGEYTTEIVDGIQDLAGSAADWLRGIASGLGQTADDAAAGKAGRAARAPRAARGEPTNDELFAEVIANAEKQQRALAQAGEQVGLYGEALSRLKYEQQLFNDAQDRGVVLTAAMSAELNQRAAAMAAQETSNARRQFAEDMRRDHEEQMWQLGREREELGMTGATLRAYRIETELLAAARAANIALSPTEIAGIRAIAEAEAVQIEAIERVAEAIDFTRETTRSFFSEWYEGIRNGENIFKSFADSVIAGLDRIVDRLLDNAITGFMDNMFSGIGGFFGGAKPNALGNAFDEGGIARFAKGGAFTNSIVSKPTLFRFASGGALGEMGEAGPEAIMPLARGRDGKLGVHVGGGRSAPVINAPINITNDNRVEGAMNSADIVAMQQRSAKASEENIRRAIPQILQQYQTDGSLA